MTIEYEDEYVRVDSEEGVTIKDYFMPTYNPKIIPWKCIKSFEWWKGKHTAIPAITYKDWGMGFSNTWWAFDLSRYEASRECVIITTGSIIRKGFTCKDPQRLIRILEAHQHKHEGHPEDESGEKEDVNAKAPSPK